MWRQKIMFYLMRHGEASWNAQADFERPLTDQGKAALVTLVDENRESLEYIKKIVCSPFLRTRQTAQIIAKSIASTQFDGLCLNAHCESVLIVTDHRLTPNSSLLEALDSIEKHWSDNLLVITHQPLIGSLVGYIEEGEMGFSMPISPASIFSYSMQRLGSGSGCRHSLFSV